MLNLNYPLNRYNFSYGNSAGVLSVDQPTGEIRLSPHLVDSNVNLRADFGVVVSDGQVNTVDLTLIELLK